MNELKFLEEQGVSSSLINKIVKFREVYPVSDEVKNRIIKPAIPFYGKDILDRGVRTPGPAAAAAALESAAHLHYVDCLQSSLISIPVFRMPCSLRKEVPGRMLRLLPG